MITIDGNIFWTGTTSATDFDMGGFGIINIRNIAIVGVDALSTTNNILVTSLAGTLLRVTNAGQIAIYESLYFNGVAAADKILDAANRIIYGSGGLDRIDINNGCLYFGAAIIADWGNEFSIRNNKRIVLSVSTPLNDGDWSFNISGTDLSVDRREGGAWVTKHLFVP